MIHQVSTVYRLQSPFTRYADWKAWILDLLKTRFPLVLEEEDGITKRGASTSIEFIVGNFWVGVMFYVV